MFFVIDLALQEAGRMILDILCSGPHCPRVPCLGTALVQSFSKHPAYEQVVTKATSQGASPTMREASSHVGLHPKNPSTDFLQAQAPKMPKYLPYTYLAPLDFMRLLGPCLDDQLT